MEQQRALKLQDVLAVMASKDSWCMAELYLIYGPYIGGVCTRMMRGTVSQEHQDLRQTAFIVLAQMAGEYRPEAASFTHHLMSYFPQKLKREMDRVDRMVSVPLNMLQQDRKKLRDTGDAEFKLNAATSISGKTISGSDGEPLGEDDYLHLICPELAVEEFPEENVLIRQIWQHVDSLQPRERKFMELYFKAGLTLEDIAAAAGISRQAVNTAMGKALYKIKEKIGVHNDTESSKPSRSIKQASRH